MFGLLDNTLPGNEDSNSVLLGPVLSSFIHSGGERLERKSLQYPVKITFPYSDSSPAIPMCVFWNFSKSM